MKCPYCGKEVEIKEVVKKNLKIYGKIYGPVKARTACCGALIEVAPVVIGFRCSKTNQVGWDDWGE